MHRSLAALVPFVLLACCPPAQDATARAPAPITLPSPVAPATRVIPYPIDLPPSFQRAIANGTRTATGRPGPSYWTNYARYRLAVELDPRTARLTGTAAMTYVNRSPHELEQLVVHCYQDLMKAEAQRTRSNLVPTKGLEIGEVRVAGKAVRAKASETRLVLRLPEPIAPGGELAIEIDYAFDVPARRTAPRMGHDGEDVFYLGYWYPQFAVFDDVEGWVADPHRGNGEFYMGYADYDLAITVPVGYLVRATGELQNAAEVLTAKARERLERARTQRDVVHVIDVDDHAAGTVTAPSDSGKLTWRFRAENVRDAAVSVARSYLWDATHAVVKDAAGPGKDGACAIHAVYRPNMGGWARAAEYARHTIEYMSAHVHPYPWPHMTACEGIIGGGMEYPMMTIVGGPQPGGTITHELIHMWFPMLVGSNEKRCAWQDEGFTSFWTTLCRDAFARRSNGPRKDILDYANRVARGGDVVSMRHADAFGGDNFGFASYGKPAAMLHQLRALIGDEMFFAAFRRYATDWAWKHPYRYDFFRTFSDVAQRDLEPYLRTWLYEAWTLDHAIASVSAADGGTTVVVADRGRALHPCVVEATLADGTKQRQTIPATLWAGAVEAKVTFRGDVVEVLLDPEVQTLDCNRDNGRWSR